jgi:hypothetical protein
MKIAIIGAGWYGCHLANSLLSLGFAVTVFEKQSTLFRGASGNNQYRLHQGFHYARNHRTRVQSREGYLRFIERYPSLSDKVEHNIYAVPRTDSIIDFPTYKLIMTSSGVDFIEVDPSDYYLINCSGALRVNERVICTDLARQYFKERLAGLLRLNTTVESLIERGDSVTVNGEVFDYVIDATWGHLTRPSCDVVYEATVLFYFQPEKNNIEPAFTFVDGPLCSVYPTGSNGVYTLSSVPFTPLGKSATVSGAYAMISGFNPAEEALICNNMVKQIRNYIPHFSEVFRYIGPQLSIKTKPIGASDDRSCYVEKEGRIIRVLSGKVDNIFFALESVLNYIQSWKS